MEEKLIDGEWVTVEDLIQKHAAFINKKITPLVPMGNRMGLTKDDLWQGACMGLMEAFKKYNPDKGVKFLTFAGMYIYGFARKESEESSYIIKIPRTKQELLLRIMRNNLVYEDTNVIAEKLGVDECKVISALKARKSVDSTDRETSDEEITVGMTLKGIDDHSWTVVNDFRGTITEREKFLLDRLIDQYTKVEIAEELGLSRVTVNRDFKKLKRSYEKYEELATV